MSEELALSNIDPVPTDFGNTGATVIVNEKTGELFTRNLSNQVKRIGADSQFTPSGMGGTTRTVAAKLADNVSPADYGGDTDGAVLRQAASEGHLFYDDFLRSDTASNTLGTPANGSAYTIVTTRGSSYIDGTVWRSDANSVLYATQILPENVTRIGGKARWRSYTGATNQGTFAMIINEAGAPFAEENALHFTTTRTGYAVQITTGGVFTTLASGSYSSALTFDKWYTFECNITRDVIHYNLAGVTGSVQNSVVLSNAGPAATWEHFYADADVLNLVEIGAVWAGATKLTPGLSLFANSSGVIFANGTAFTNVASSKRVFYAGGTSGYSFLESTGVTEIAHLTDAGYFGAVRFYLGSNLLAYASGSTHSLIAGTSGISLTASDGSTVRLKVDQNGNVAIGSAQLADAATDGFFYIPTTTSGAPSGTPTAFTGRVPMVYDDTNNKLYIYNGAWKSVTLA